MKIEVIANQKGGTGKSIVAYNKAHYLSQIRKQRVLFIDGDEQGSASSSLNDFHTDLKASDFFLGKKIILPDERCPKNSNLIVAKSDIGLRDISSLKKEEQREFIEDLRKSLVSVEEKFDWCVIDTPGANSPIPSASMIVADYVLIPSIIDKYSLDVTITMLKRALGIQRELNKKLVILGILPTLLEGTSPTQKRDMESFFKEASQFVIRTKISRKGAYREAANEGVPIFDLKTTSGREAAKEMKQAFDLIATKMGI